jgi:hypothetical protein
MLTTGRAVDVGIWMSRLVEAGRRKEAATKKKTEPGATEMRVEIAALMY